MPIDELIQVLNISNRTNPTNYILLNDAIAKIDTENIKEIATPSKNALKKQAKTTQLLAELRKTLSFRYEGP